MKQRQRTIVIMGVSGSGKSLMGRMLAAKLNAAFEDADDFHSASNKEKMSRGIPLTDEDRLPWYKLLRERIVAHRAGGSDYVLACSALKQRYRAMLRGSDLDEDLIFIYLNGSRDIINARITARLGHFMPPALLDSQFAALEEPAAAIVIEASQSPNEILRKILERLRQQNRPQVE